MKVLVTGDREGFDPQRMLEVLNELPDGTIIIHGAARGVDKMAGEIAKLLGFEVREYPADWKKYGRGAGPVRNRQMFDAEQPDLVIAFHRDLDKSKGTKDMVTYAESKNCTVKRISE